MNIQSLSLPRTDPSVVRVSGFSASKFKVATWRGDDLLVQMQDGAVLVVKAANAVHLSAPNFFLVFDDAAVPLAQFALGEMQPLRSAPPHVPPYAQKLGIKVVRRPGASKKQTVADEDEWADKALDVLNAPETKQSSGMGSLVQEPTSERAAPVETVAARSPTAQVELGTASTAVADKVWPALLAFVAGGVALSQSGGASPDVADTQVGHGTVTGTIVLGPVVASNDLLVKVYDVHGHLLGSNLVNGDGSYTVKLDRSPATGVVEVEVVGYANAGKPDYVSEATRVEADFVGTLKSVAAWNGVSAVVNVTQVTDAVARKVHTDAALVNKSAQDVDAITKAAAKVLNLGDGTVPLELLLPVATVKLDGSANPDADLYGHLLDVLSHQVDAKQNDGVAAAQALDEVQAALAADLPLGEGTPAGLSFQQLLDKATQQAQAPNINDLPTGDVTISGTATQGQTLTASHSLADADGLGTISYQWQADGVDIGGATNATLALTQTLVGKTISVKASYTDGAGTRESKTSAATAAVANINDAPTGDVTISGTATQGQTLTANHSLADADGLGTISYQWQADGVDISGATGNSLTLTQVQVGKTISVKASYTDGAGTPESKTSAATSAVAYVNEAPSALVLNSELPQDKIAQNTPTTERIKLADVVVTDDGYGSNTFSLVGADSASFEVDATGLYLKSGVVLNAATKPNYAVTVKVSDASLPDVLPVSSDFSLTVTPPVLMPSFRLLNDVGQSNLDGLSAQGTVIVANVAAGNTWQFSTDGGASWQDGTGDRFELPEGEYTVKSIQVRQIDAVTGGAGPAAQNTALPSSLLRLLSMNGEIFVFWDKSSDGLVAASGSSDVVQMVALASKLGITGTVSESNRMGLLDGKLVAIPVFGNASLPTASSSVTLVPDSVLGTDGLAALWDFVNGVGTGARGVPSGWISSNYLTATPVDASFAKLNLGNGATSLGTSGYVALQLLTPAAVTIDKTSAVVNAVALDGASGTTGPWGAGEVVRAHVELSEVVYVTGLPKLTLRIGDQHVEANYVSGSGTSTLLFEYTLPEGLTDLDGISIAANALKNWGGDIQDKAGTSANLALSAVDNNANWKVDSHVPDAPVLRLLSDTGVSAVDGLTSNGTVKLSGFATEGRWEYSLDGGANWQVGSGDQLVLPVGTYAAGQIQARQYDASGRVSAVQTAFDRAPLNLSIDRISDDDAVQLTQATTVSGHAAAHANVQLNLGSLSAVVQADDAGRWQWTLSAAQWQTLGQGVQSASASVDGLSLHRDVWVTGALPNRVNEWAGDALRIRFYTNSSGIDSVIASHSSELQAMDGVGPIYGGSTSISDASWRTLAQKGLTMPFLFQYPSGVSTGGSMADGNVTDDFLNKLYDKVYAQVVSVLTNPLKNSVVSNWYAYEEVRNWRAPDMNASKKVLQAIRDAEDAYGVPARPFEEYQPNHADVTRLDAFDHVFDVIEKGAYVQVGDSTLYTKILDASRVLVEASRSDTPGGGANTGAVGTEYTPQLALAAYDPVSGVTSQQYQTGLRVGYYLALSQGVQGINIWSYYTRTALVNADGTVADAGLTSTWRDALFSTYAALGQELNEYEPELGQAIARGLWMDPAASVGRPVSFSSASSAIEGGSFFINGSQYLILVNTSAADSASVQLTRNDADYTLWREVLRPQAGRVLSVGEDGSWSALNGEQQLTLEANSVKIIRVTDPHGLGAQDSLPITVEAPLGPPPAPVLDTVVPDWITASAYQVETPVAASLLSPGSYAQGMGSLLSNDVSASKSVDDSMSSWLSMNASGTMRQTGASMSSPLALTYAFQNVGASYKSSSGVEHQTTLSYADNEKAFARKVFGHFSSVCNVVFTESDSQAYAGAAGGADMRLFKGSHTEYGVPSSVMGFAYQPTGSNPKSSDLTGNFFLVTDASGYPTADRAFAGEYGNENATVTHELGHAMGLDHPFADSAIKGKYWFGDATQTATSRLDNVTGGGYDNPQTDAPQETIMTYLQVFQTMGLSGAGATAFVESHVFTPWKLGVYDVAALQHLYGANMSYATGNDVYGYDSNVPVFDTIWDAKGNDTLQQMGSRDAVIDLRGGEHMSRMGQFSGASYTFSQNAWEDAKLAAQATKHPDWTDAKLTNLRFVFVDSTGAAVKDTAGSEMAVGILRSEVVDGDTRWTWFDDPTATLPAGASGVGILAEIDYYKGVSKVAHSSAVLGGVPLGNVPDASMAYNVSIAFGVVIENAIGGDGNDTIWGNATSNQITTGAGRDVVKYQCAADINGDTIVDFSASDKLDLSALTGLTLDKLDWNASSKKLTYIDQVFVSNSWAMTINGAFDKAHQVLLA